MASVIVSDELRTEMVTAGGAEVEVFDSAGNRIGVLAVDDPEPTIEELEERMATAVWVPAEQVLDHLRRSTKCE